MKKLVLLLTAAVFVLVTALPVWAKEPATLELTLSQAVSLALEHSEAVKKAASQVDLTWDKQDYQSEQLGFTPTGPSGNPEVEVAWANVMTATLEYSMAKRSLKVAEDTVALDACKKYWAVQNSLGAVEVAEQSLKQADLELNKAKVSCKVGLISTDALLAAESQQAGAKYALAKAQNDLDTAYTAFNQLVGLWSVDRPVLVDEIAYIPMENPDEEYAVAYALSNSPTVWLSEQNVNMQEIFKDLMFYTGNYRTYEARKIEAEQAKLDAVGAREAAEILARNLFYSVRVLEENYPVVEQTIKLAEENLRVGQLKYQLGMLTKAEVSALETALAQARQGLLELKNNHAYLKLTLEKPWAASSRVT
ncbi:MAG: TolC family protein [Firmicutes bacterium]|nr:TolC family protein [Bacillota bacterium]